MFSDTLTFNQQVAARIEYQVMASAKEVLELKGKFDLVSADLGKLILRKSWFGFDHDVEIEKRIKPLIDKNSEAAEVLTNLESKDDTPEDEDANAPSELLVKLSEIGDDGIKIASDVSQAEMAYIAHGIVTSGLSLPDSRTISDILKSPNEDDLKRALNAQHNGLSNGLSPEELKEILDSASGTIHLDFDEEMPAQIVADILDEKIPFKKLSSVLSRYNRMLKKDDKGALLKVDVSYASATNFDNFTPIN